MKVCRVLLSFVAILFAFSPEAYSQSADVTAGCVNTLVNFEAPTGAASYYWNFDDNGATSTIANPSHLFTEPGSYQVTFQESMGSMDIDTVEISIYNIPQLKFSTDVSSGCAPLEISFQDVSDLDPDLMITEYSWTFGDGGSSTAAMPTYVYQDPGVYSISLAITTNYQTCDNAQQWPNIISVFESPEASFTTLPNPPISCSPPLEVTINNTSPRDDVTFSWDFGNGNTSTDADPPMQNYADIGEYPITLTVTNNGGCSTQATTTAIVGVPEASFSGIADTVCVSSQQFLVNESPPGTYFWEFSPGIDYDSDTIRNPSIILYQGGDATIKLTYTAPDGCSSDTTVQVFVDDIQLDATVDPAFTCESPVTLNFDVQSAAAINYYWVFPDGSWSTEQSPSYTWMNEDTTIYSVNGNNYVIAMVSVGSRFGCQRLDSTITIINIPNARFEADTTEGCVPLTVNFTDKSSSSGDIVMWNWDFGDATMVSNTVGDPVSHTFTMPGDYTVQLSIENDEGCRDTSYTIVISVGDTIANLAFEVDKTMFCIGDTVTFSSLAANTDTLATHFYIDGNSVAQCMANDTLSYVFGHTIGKQEVSMEVWDRGCPTFVTYQDSLTLMGPKVDLNYKLTCDDPLDLVYEVVGEDYDEVTIYFGDGDSTFVENGTHVYADTGAYMVVLKATSMNGCPDYYDTTTVYIHTIKAAFELLESYCIGEPYPLDGTSSTHVNAICHKGYKWQTSQERDIVVDQVYDEFTLNQRGIVEISLIVENINQCRDTLTQYTKVYQIDAMASASPTSICIPGTVDFSVSYTADTSIASIEWVFSDGAMAVGTDVTHTFTDPSIPPTATVTITDDRGCPNVQIIELNTFEVDSDIIPSVNPQLCIGDDISFTATNPSNANIAWTWDLGNGETGSGQTSSTVYNAAGLYTVTLNYVDASQGCMGTRELTVEVQEPPIAAIAIADATGVVIGNTNAICGPDNLLFIDNSQGIGLSQQWTFSTGQTSSNTSPGFFFPIGTHNVTLVSSTSFGCTDETTIPFTLLGPQATVILDREVICPGDEVTLIFRDIVDVDRIEVIFGGGMSQMVNLNDPVLTHIFTEPGTYNIQAVMYGVLDNCNQSLDIPSVEVIDVMADFVFPTDEICVGSPVSFANLSQDADTYEWSFGTVGTSTLEDPIFVFPDAGTYTVTLEATNSALGCSKSVSKDITITNSLFFALNTDTVTICQGDTASFFVSEGFLNDYTWTLSGGSSIDETAPAFSVAPNTSTTYTVSADNGEGCASTNSIFIEVLEQDYPGQGNFVVANVGETVNLNATNQGGYNFQWKTLFGDSLGMVIQTGPELTVPNVQETQTYQLCVTQTDMDICPQEVLYLIAVSPVMPNAFTPGSGKSEDRFFKPVWSEAELMFVEKARMIIHDRWGTQVFDGDALGQGWDGKHNDKDANSDSYVYVLEVTYQGEDFAGTVKGDFLLVR